MWIFIQSVEVSLRRLSDQKRIPWKGQCISASLKSIDAYVWCVDPGWKPGAHRSHSISPLLNRAGERKFSERLMG